MISDNKMTRDMRSLSSYRNHFRRFNMDVENPSGVSGVTMGIVETIGNKVVFIPLLYCGEYLKSYEVR